MTTTKKLLINKEKPIKNTKNSKKLGVNIKLLTKKQNKDINTKKEHTHNKDTNTKKEHTHNKDTNTKKEHTHNKDTNLKGGSDICSRDLNELLAGNPMILMGKDDDVNFSKEMSAAGQSFSKDVMSSFGGIDKGWDGSPGMPPKFPSGCTLM